jgi:hypothetical protein
MGDFDSELYNTASETYNEMVRMGEIMRDIDRNLRELVAEIKGLRDDLKRQ